MAYYAMGDLHFSGNPPKKPMNIFNPHWSNHCEKIITYWKETVTDEDTVFLVGDISWAMRLDEAQEDLNTIMALPGKKIMVRGNHDYWWSSKRKLQQATDGKITFLQAEALDLGDCAVGGTRGYLCPGDANYKPKTDESVYKRELLRAEMALEELKKINKKPTIFLMHYPPFNDRQESSGFTELLEKYDVDYCIFGHLHTFDNDNWIPQNWSKTKLHLVSSNFLDFKVKRIDL